MILLSHFLNRRIYFKRLNSRRYFTLFKLNRELPYSLRSFSNNKPFSKSIINRFKIFDYAINYNSNYFNIVRSCVFLLLNRSKLDTININLTNGLGSVLYYLLKNKMSPACVMQSIKSSLPSEFISENTIATHNSLDINNVVNHGMNNNLGMDNGLGINVNLHSLNSHMLKKDEDQPRVQSVDESVSSNSDSVRSEHSLLPRSWYFPQNRYIPPNESFNFHPYKVMSFNTLAQSLVDYKYVENDQTTMSWSKRRNEIFKVIEESDCDILCLQEIDELDYINFFKEKVDKLAYESVYKRKLQNRMDGVLTMFKRDRYELVMKRELNFSSEQEEYDKPQVALVVVLRDLYTCRRPSPPDSASCSSAAVATGDSAHLESDSSPIDDLVIVSNTHLIFNKSRGDIKLYQLCSLLSGVKIIYDELVASIKGTSSGPSDPSTSTPLADASSSSNASVSDASVLLPNVILCGDLNLTPQSLMYNLLFQGFAPLKHTNPRCISGQYLMFDKTYLTSSSGHSESGETMGSVKHYVSDVYGNDYSFDASQDFGSNVTTGFQSFERGYEQDQASLAPWSTNWYDGVLRQLNPTHFFQKPEHVDSHRVKEFLDLINDTVKSEFELSRLTDEIKTKLMAPSSKRSSVDAPNFDEGFTGLVDDSDELALNADGDSADPRSDISHTHDGVIYCPLKLSSAYSVDDGVNYEPAFTAFHGWQKGCVDYICYNPDHTLLQGVYEMPLYTQVRQNGDLPHKKWPVSDHFSLISKFKRIK